MNTIMIDNMIQNQGYKLSSFDATISRRRVYIPTPKTYHGDEYYEPDQTEDRKRTRFIHRVCVSLVDPKTGECVDFEEDFTDIKKLGNCVETLGEIFEKHDDLLYKEV